MVSGSGNIVRTKSNRRTVRISCLNIHATRGNPKIIIYLITYDYTQHLHTISLDNIFHQLQNKKKIRRERWAGWGWGVERGGGGGWQGEKNAKTSKGSTVC